MRVANAVSQCLATWFGTGLSPLAPGTVGSLGAVPLHLLLRGTSPTVHVGAVVAVSVLGTWSAQRLSELRGEEDPQRVVIDEVAGTLIAMGMVRSLGPGIQVLALVLFRALDILKPGPIRQAEKLRPPGLGIMADDWAAGVAAGLLALGAGHWLF